MDEMDQVVGGASGLMLNGKWVPEEDVNNLYINMAGIFGYEIAAATFCKASGFSKTEIAKASWGCQSDKESMYCLITQCLTTFGKIGDGGKTF